MGLIVRDHFDIVLSSSLFPVMGLIGPDNHHGGKYSGLFPVMGLIACEVLDC